MRNAHVMVLVARSSMFFYRVCVGVKVHLSFLRFMFSGRRGLWKLVEAAYSVILEGFAHVHACFCACALAGLYLGPWTTEMLSDSLSKHVTFAVVKTHSTQYILPASLQDYQGLISIRSRFISYFYHKFLPFATGLYYTATSDSFPIIRFSIMSTSCWRTLFRTWWCIAAYAVNIPTMLQFTRAFD